MKFREVRGSVLKSWPSKGEAFVVHQNRKLCRLAPVEFPPRETPTQIKQGETTLLLDHRKNKGFGTESNRSTGRRYADFSPQYWQIASVLQALQLEQQVETVVKVLQPGPLGIVEHNYTTDEIRNAKATVRRAVANWRRNADMEKNNPILKDSVN